MGTGSLIPKEKPMKPTSRVPILLSAFVCPGLGQLAQKRWQAGALVMSGFLTGFCWVMILAIGNIAACYSLIDNPDVIPKVEQPQEFILPFGIAVTFYLISLFDVFSAQQRIARKIREEAFANELLSKNQSRDS